MTTQQREADNIKWVEIQKKAFTFWVNRQLIKREEVPQVEDLQPDLANGVRLVALVEVLSNKPLEMKWSKQPVMKAHKITNCVLALGHLKNENVGHLTVSAENFVNSDERELPLILGFCWQLLRKYQNVGGSKNSSYEQSLLEWLRSILKDYDDINLDDGFKSKSFHDGKAFLGLINEYRKGVIDYPSFSSETKFDNCKTAFHVSEEQLGIPSLIDPLEMSEGKTSDKNIVLYLSLWFNAFKELNQGISKEELMRRIQELEDKIRKMMEENEELRRRLLSGIDASAVKAEQDITDILRMLEELMKLKQGMQKENEEMAEKNRVLREKLAREERDIEKLQMHLCETQERDGGAAIRLHKSLAKHVQDMHTWKGLLDYDREYLSTDLHVRMEDQLLSTKVPEETFGEIDVEFNKEVALLAKLFDSPKESTAATSVAVEDVDRSANTREESAPKQEATSNQESRSESSSSEEEASSTTQESSLTSSSSESPIISKKSRKSKK